MRSIVLATAACAALAVLPGCATIDPATGQVTPVVTPVTPSSSLVGTVIADIKLGCGIVADSGPLLLLINSAPYLSTASAIANAACDAFRSVTGARRGGSGYVVAHVNGVQITGRYVTAGGRRHRR